MVESTIEDEARQGGIYKPGETNIRPGDCWGRKVSQRYRGGSYWDERRGRKAYRCSSRKGIC